MAPKKGANNARGAIREAKIRAATEMQLKGVPGQVVANAFAIHRDTLHQWNKQARQLGILDEIREKLTDQLLPKAVLTYEQILDTPAELLVDAEKGHNIKLKAARDIAQGVGAFQKESAVKKMTATMDLESYMKYRELSTAPEVIDVEPIEQDFPVDSGFGVGADSAASIHNDETPKG